MNLSDFFLYVFGLGLIVVGAGAVTWNLLLIASGGVLCLLSVLAETALEVVG